MSDVVIRCEGLSKKYRIGTGRYVRYVALRDVLADRFRSWGRRLLGRGTGETPASDEEIWALKDVSFEVKRGECVGIIGRNGAGKSTLLKLLSRITEPTEGRIRLRGRVASLLEVGTGFHPELTGRENIYLNGAILGMKRTEIRRKFDEIAAFAEVEKFLETPVKHYSTGMYMRLAFAVAAHLEPEILIVDEVLAVGDMAFQKKCIGKMGEVAQQGRTVLFVSHNMQAVSQLTGLTVVLNHGQLDFKGSTTAGVAKYNADLFGTASLGVPYSAGLPKSGTYLALARLQTSTPHGEHVCQDPISFEFAVQVDDPPREIAFSFQVCDESGRPVCHFWLLGRGRDFSRGPGLYRFNCTVPKLRVYMGRYTLTTWLSDRRGNESIESLSGICPFEVTMRGVARDEYDWVPSEMVYMEECRWGPVAKPVDNLETSAT